MTCSKGLGRYAKEGELGPAEEKGYLHRGIWRNVHLDKGVHKRAVDNALARVKGLPFKTDLKITVFEKIEPRVEIADL
jgi:glycine reductase complex component B subunit gamma